MALTKLTNDFELIFNIFLKDIRRNVLQKGDSL